LPHYIIHIGPHKTGSSHLQNCFAANRQRLEDAGIHLAQIWDENPGKPSHTGLFHRLSNEKRFELEPMFAAWRESHYRSVLISCEAIAALSLEPAKVEILRELTRGSPVTLVYYVRRWSNLLASEWQQYVKQGFTKQFPEVLVHNLRDPWHSRAISIDVSLKIFADIFGRDSIRLVSYECVRDSMQDISAHFAQQFLDGVTLAPPSGHDANLSLAPERIELMRLFNCMDPQARPRHHLHRFLTHEYTPAPMSRLLAHMARHEGSLLLSDDDTAVRDVLLANRKDYAACAVAPVEEARFYPVKTERVRFIRPDYALTPGFAEELHKLRRDLLAIDPS
jgi:hypothetical protein